MRIEHLNIPFPDFRLGDIIEPDEHDANNHLIVSRINEIKNVVNQILEGSEDGSGASIISLDKIAPFTSEKLQSFLEDVVNRLTSSTSGSSGSEFISSPTIPDLVGNTTYSQLVSLKSYLDTLNNAQVTHQNKAVIDHPDGSVTTPKLADSVVTTAKIADSSVVNAKIANNAVTTTKIQDNSIITSKIADSSVTTAKITNNAITSDKIASGAVGSQKIDSNAVITAKIANNSVTEPKIADSAVGSRHIQNNSIGSGKLQSNSVITSKIQDGAVTLSKIGVDIQASVNLHKSFIATAGQTAFDISDVGTYPINTNALEVWVSGIKQISGANFFETSPTVFTLSEGVVEGEFVEARWRRGLMPVTSQGHQSAHQKGGLDEIPIRGLAGFEDVITKDNVSGYSGGLGIVIAPFDAMEESKQKANFVLNGTNDAEVINQIIANLSNPNAVWGRWKIPELYFTEGQINVEKTIILRDSVNIRGSGKNTIFRLNDGALCDMFGQEIVGATLYHTELSNFWIDGNYENNKGTPYFGIHIYPQEVTLSDLWIYNCYSGARMYGEGTYGAFVKDCMIQNNFSNGMWIGGDTIVTGCGFGQNGLDPDAEWLHGSGGVVLAGWNSQIVACHFAYNLVDIFSNWGAYNQIQSSIFEAGIKENIILEGRAWGYTISGNRFGGRRRTHVRGLAPSIKFQYINPDEGSYGNIISNNSFTCYESGDIGYSTCIIESENCHSNLIVGNIFKGGYETNAVTTNSPETLIANNLE